jgi:hypothetical protein
MEEITVEAVICAACAKPGVRGRMSDGHVITLVHCSCRTDEEVATIRVRIEVTTAWNLWGTPQKRVDTYDWSLKPITKGAVK